MSVQDDQSQINNASKDTSLEQQDALSSTPWQPDDNSPADFLLAVEQLGEAVVMVKLMTDRAHIIKSNQIFTRWFGVVDDQTMEVIAPDNQIHKMLQASAQSTGHIIEQPFDLRNGGIIWCDVRWIRLSKPLHFLLLFKDVEERRQIAKERAALQQTHRLHLLSQGIGHKLNNPLSYAKSNLDMGLRQLELLRQSSDDASIRDAVEQTTSFLEDAQQGLERAVDIVQNTLSMQQRNTTPMTITTLNPILDQAIDRALDEFADDLTIIKRVEEGLELHCHVEQIEQAIYSMLAHAVSHHIAGIPLTVELMVSKQPPWIQLNALYQHIEQLGNSISEEMSSDRDLLLCQVVVEAHEGSVEMSRDGMQECFSLLLPMAKQHAKRREVSPQHTYKPRLLVLDDEPPILKLIRRVLSSDYHVTVVSTPSQAISVLKQGVAIDAILCDIVMPEMNGVEFFLQLEHIAPDINRKFTFISGGGYSTKVEALIKARGLSILQKPFSAHDLRQHVEHLLTPRTPPHHAQ